jgi:hypothetical protein
MIRDEQITEEYHKLVLQIAKSNYALSFFHDIEKFCEKYFPVLENKSFIWKCRSMASFILEKNQRWEDALVINKKLLYEIPSNNPFYSNLLQRTAEALVQTGKNEEAYLLVENHLQKKPESSFDVLNLLRWYVEHMNANEKRLLEKFTSAVKTISKDLGITISGKDIKEDILHLSSENKLANRKYSELILSFKGLPMEGKIKRLESFIKDTRVGYYQQMAKKNIRSYQDKK